MTKEEAMYLLNNLRSVAEGKEDEAIDMAIEALSEQKTGEWIKSNLLPHGWHCSHCDSPVMTDDIEEMLFCPNCGAKMVREDGEEE